MSRRRQPKVRELIRGATKQVYEPQGGRLSGFAVVIVIALSGVIFSVAPLSLGLAPASIWDDLLISFAISCWFWGLVGLLVETTRLKDLLAINREGWSSLAIATFLILPVVAIYLGLALFALPALLESIFTVIALGLCFPAALAIAATFDEFFIKPRLERITSRDSRRRAKQGRSDEIVGSIVAVAIWLLATFANLFSVLEQLLPKG